MMKGQIAGLMKQAQAMQDNMKKMQEQLALIEVEGQSGAGMVKIVMTCKNDVKRVSRFDIKFSVVGAEMGCDLLRTLGFIITAFVKTDGEGLYRPGTLRLHCILATPFTPP